MIFKMEIFSCFEKKEYPDDENSLFKPEISVPSCYKCQLTDCNSFLLTCSICGFAAHPACYIFDFPDGDIAQKTLWICNFCRVIESDSIFTAQFNKSDYTLEIKHEGAFRKEDYQHFGIKLPLVLPKKTTTEPLLGATPDYFLRLEDETYALVGNYDLSHTFPLKEDIPAHKPEIIIFNLEEEEETNSPKNQETYCSVKIDSYAANTPAAQCFDSNDDECLEVIWIDDDQWLVEEIFDGKEMDGHGPEMYIVSHSIELGDYFFVDCHPDGTKLAERAYNIAPEDEMEALVEDDSNSGEFIDDPTRSKFFEHYFNCYGATEF